MYAVFRYKHLLTTIRYFWRLCTTFGDHIQLWKTFGCYVLLLTGIYYFSRLCITFNGYILFLALLYCDFARIQDFPAISHIWLKARLNFNINLALIKFFFFCILMVSSINFNLPFWKCCFITNTQMLKMWNFLQLTFQMFHKGNKSANVIHKLNPYKAELHSSSKYLRITLVFMWNSAVQEKFHFFLFKSFLIVLTNFSFW